MVTCRAAQASTFATLLHRQAAGRSLLHYSMVLNCPALGRLRILEPKHLVQRYEREYPGGMIHFDV